MKRTIYILIIFCMSYTILAADQIHLKDSTVIKGKIIQISKNSVEYDPEGEKPFLVIPNDNILKIAFDDGRVVDFSEKHDNDAIFLKNGNRLYGRVIKITHEAVIYTSASVGTEETIKRSDIVMIIFHYNETSTIPDEPLPVEEEYTEQPEEETTRSGGFIDSFIRIGFIWGFYDLRGAIEKKENKIYEDYEDQIFTDNSNYYNDEPGNSGEYTGIDMDLMLPAIKYVRKRGFDLTGIKFGIKSMYLFHKVDQDLYDSTNDKTINRGKLLDYNSINCGPEMNILFSPRNSVFDMLVQFYLTGGYIHEGKITAAPVVRDAGIIFNRADYSAEFTGYSVTFGAGLHFVFNALIPSTFGFAFQWGYSKIEFENKLPVYENAATTSFNDFGLNLSIAVHL